MNIIFDIDDTITNETGFMLKYAPKYLKKKYGIDAQIKNPNGYNVSEVFGLREIFSMDSTLTEDEIEGKCMKATNGFWNSHFVRYMFYPLKKGTREAIKNLKKQNCNIYFLSCRGKKTKEVDTKLNEFIRLKIVPFLTKMQLKMNAIPYNQLMLVQNEEEKLEFIKKIKPKFVFDDQISLLEKVPAISKPICVATSHNQNIEKIKRIESFDEIHELDLMDKKKNSKSSTRYKNVKFYERAFTESFYVLARYFSKKKLIAKFQPIVCGLDNVPNDKRAVIYTGNHRNNFDPLISTLFIDEPTHWAALLRLFEAKENLFGRDDIYLLRKLSSLLIKSMGCVPIARKTDANYSKINLQSIMKLDEYIKLGSSIGFYPEGTINRKPEEQNILPLASDTIFSIAKRNNAWLQPVTTIWVPKDIHIPNKVVLIFPKAIETTGMSVNEIKSEWEKSLNDNIEMTKELFENIRKIENSEEENKQLKKELTIQTFKMHK